MNGGRKTWYPSQCSENIVPHLPAGDWMGVVEELIQLPQGLIHPSLVSENEWSGVEATGWGLGRVL